MADTKESGKAGEFEQALLAVDRVKATGMLKESARQASAIEAIEDIVAPALADLGSKWDRGEISLSEVYMGGRISEDAVDAILPPESAERKTSGRIAIAVLRDSHGLGKRTVYSALRAAGYTLLDYGEALSVEELVNRAIEDDIEILLISVLMLPSALSVKDVSARLKGADRDVKIIVGGAPFRFDESLWREVGADATANTASDAIKAVAALVEDG